VDLALLDTFCLDPAVLHLNHGAYRHAELVSAGQKRIADALGTVLSTG